jgi:hypothetical protein
LGKQSFWSEIDTGMNEVGRQTGRLMPEFPGIFVLLVLREGRFDLI